MKNMLSTLVILLLAVALVAGCSASTPASNTGNTKGETPAPAQPDNKTTNKTDDAVKTPDADETALPPVELIWYYPLTQTQADQQKVEDAVNTYITEKINASVKLIPVPVGDYVQKMNTVLAAGEPFDIMWSGYLLKTEALMRKGALQPISDLLDNYAPDLKADVPQVIWDGLTIDGEIYGIPNQQISAYRHGVTVQKRFADKYNLNPADIHKMEDLEPFLEQVKQNEPDIIPYGNFGSQYYPRAEFWPVQVGSDIHFTVKKDDDTYQLLNFSEGDITGYQLASKWYKAGYIYKDAGTSKMSDFQPKGAIAVIGSTTLKPGVEQEEFAKNGGHEVIAIPLNTWYTNGYSDATSQAISRTSANPDRAMMFLNLVSTDPMLYNLLANGIEGEHYDKVADNVIKARDNSRYAPNMDWVFGSVFNSYLKEGQSPTLWEETKEINNTAEINPVGAFKFDSSAVATELANLNAVWGEYKLGLSTGTLDFDETWPTLLDRLNKAGQQKYADEVQRQFDLFLVEIGLK